MWVKVQHGMQLVNLDKMSNIAIIPLSVVMSEESEDEDINMDDHEIDIDEIDDWDDNEIMAILAQTGYGEAPIELGYYSLDTAREVLEQMFEHLEQDALSFTMPRPDIVPKVRSEE